MFLKWIVCQVRAEMRDPFALAQTKWTELAAVPGFIGQLGGWDLNSVNEACVLGLWQNHDSYKLFMERHHDGICANNEQSQTYEAIEVSLLQPLLDMPGEHTIMADCLSAANIIRVADCYVKPERERHFLEIQEEVWIPAMSKAPGMLAGSFSKAIGNSVRYIVTTLWTSVDTHEQYARNVLPSLRKAASVSEDIKEITGRLVKVNADWLVVPD